MAVIYEPRCQGQKKWVQPLNQQPTSIEEKFWLCNRYHFHTILCQTWPENILLFCKGKYHLLFYLFGFSCFIQVRLKQMQVHKPIKQVPPQLIVFICAYHSAALGLSPNHTIYAFFHLKFSLCYICHVKRTKINKQDAGFGLLF